MWSPEKIAALLAEDVPYGDLTTDLLGIGSVPARMVFRLRQAGVVAGIEAAAQIIRAAGGTAELQSATGARVHPTKGGGTRPKGSCRKVRDSHGKAPKAVPSSSSHA